MPMDSELAAVFRAESEEHLKTLTQGFLAMESQTAKSETLEEMFRAAHRFKGAARVVGAEGLEAVTHRLEDLMESMRAGHLVLTCEQHDVLSGLMDGLGELVLLALEGEDKCPKAETLLKALDTAFLPRREPAPPEPRTTSVVPVQPPPGSDRPFTLDTLRVPTQRLDELLNLAGELLVSHQRLKRRAEEADRHADSMEELHRRNGRLDPLWDTAHSQAQQLAGNLREDGNHLDSLLGALEDAVRRARLVPLSRLFDQMPKWVRDLARQTGKEAALEIAGGGIEVDKRILEGLKDPLLHLLRNALDHGLEPAAERTRAGKPERGVVRVRAEVDGDRVRICAEDDGQGVDPDTIRRTLAESGRMEPAQAEALSREALFHQLFLPGFSTRREADVLSGRGVGLDLVRAQVEDLKGTVTLHSEPGQGTRVEIQLPLSLATTRVLLVEAQHMRFGIPAASVQCCRQLPANLRFPVEGRECFLQDGDPLLLLPLARLLGAKPEEGKRREPQMVVVLQHLGERVGLGVDGLLGEQEILQKPLGPRLKTLTHLSGAALLGDGGLCLILNPSDLMAKVQGLHALAELPREAPAGPRPNWRVLLADDSLTTRIQLRRVLESADFDVTLAVDGVDAWSKLAAQPFDALVSDVDMPGLDGFGLTERVRATETTAKLPVVLVTGLAKPEQQKRGLDAGANAYLLKTRFDQTELIDTLNRLL